MSLQQKKSETIRFKKPLYQLLISYFPCYQGKEIQENSQKLSIFLKTKRESKLEAYKIQFSKINEPKQLISIFSSFQIIFDCLKDEACFEVDTNKGRVLLKGEFQMKGKKIQRKCYINLQKYQISDNEEMLQNIFRLEQQVQNLKQEKAKIEFNLKKEYQIKFQQLSKAHELFVEKKQLQDRQSKERQKEYIAQIKNLKRYIEGMSKKLQENIKNQAQERKRIKSEINRIQRENNQVKESLEQFQTIKKGHQGRKRHPQIDDQLQRRQIQNQYIDSVLESPEKKGRNQDDLCSSLIGLKDTSKNKNRSGCPEFVIDCPYVNQFEFHYSKITYKGSKKSRYLLFNYRQQVEKRKQYEIRVSRLKNYMKIGVIEQKQSSQFIEISQRETRFSYSSSGVIEEYLTQNQKNGSEKKQIVNVRDCRQSGFGFQEGDTVNISIQLEKNYLQWKVQGTLQASSRKFYLKLNRYYVPFIQFMDEGDCVFWMGQR